MNNGTRCAHLFPCLREWLLPCLLPSRASAHTSHLQPPPAPLPLLQETCAAPARCTQGAGCTLQSSSRFSKHVLCGRVPVVRPGTAHACEGNASATYRYGIMRMTIMLAMLALCSSMASVLLDGECDIAYGASPLAWGLVTWWIVDTAARVTLWPLRDATRLRKVAVTYKNLSNFLLLLCAPL